MPAQLKTKKKEAKPSQKEELQLLLTTHLQYLKPILGEKKFEKRIKKASRIILEDLADLKKELVKTAKPAAKKTHTKKKAVPAKKTVSSKKASAKKVVAKKQPIKVITTEVLNNEPLQNGPQD